MVRVLLELVGHELQQSLLDLQRVLPGRDVGAIGDPENMRIDGDRRLSERHVQNDIRGFATDAGQRFQRLATLRNFATVFEHQAAGGLDDVLRLHTIEPDRLDVLLQAFLAERHELLDLPRAYESPDGGVVSLSALCLSWH